MAAARRKSEKKQAWTVLVLDLSLFPPGLGLLGVSFATATIDLSAIGWDRVGCQLRARPM